MDYIIRFHEDKKGRKKIIKILDMKSKVVGEMTVDTRSVVVTESTLLEVADIVAKRLCGGKDRQKSFLIESDLPKMPRSGK